jgi:hypothetical protein
MTTNFTKMEGEESRRHDSMDSIVYVGGVRVVTSALPALTDALLRWVMVWCRIWDSVSRVLCGVVWHL